MTITLTQTAAQEIKRLQTSRQKPHTLWRVTIKPGGCAGWCYTLDLVETQQPGDRTYQSQGITILTDESSHPHLEGLKIDYSEDLMGGSFRFDNPQTFSSCSCGQSFSLKTYLSDQQN